MSTRWADRVADFGCAPGGGAGARGRPGAAFIASTRQAGGGDARPVSRRKAGMAALLAEGLKVSDIACGDSNGRRDYVRWLTKQAYRKLGATGQVELVRQVLAVDALPRR